MDAFPFDQEIIAMDDHLVHQTSQIRSFYGDAVDELGAKQIDLCLSRSRDMDMRRFVIERVDDEAKTKSAMNDNHDIL